MKKSHRTEVYVEIENERDHQDSKWGPVDKKHHDLPAWMLIMRKELEEAEHAWMKEGNHNCKKEILQVVAVGIAALEQHGVVGRGSK